MTIDQITEEAERRLSQDRDEKIQAVRRAGESGLALTEARELLAAAEREHNQNHAAALRQGWTAKDLKDFGIEQATKSSGGRPKRTTSAPAAE
ncbi:hypothetical protein AL755_03580 (plasmid) [Arthrobacter sp. ERGS1:01]|uniref:hypothetical protein n=1 Tax=Arthrobacter sp. ERGS1:01 TaxID=1704044 RepID=UPI0006B6369A|nr:hypothetical protein [Arthrobacter sp. ERGS1:01]ALE04780.1 hypothetical protein AL755_03580 [Arthrobacter sp. ERGS1:01]